MGRKKYASRRQLQTRVQPQQKANPNYAGIIAFTDLPNPVQMPKNYKGYAQQGFAADDTLYKCVTYIIQNGAAIPPKLYTDATMSKEITSHALLDMLAHPNVEQTGVDYREAVLGYFLIAANSYQYAIRKTNPNGPPDELWTLEPGKVSAIVDKTIGITSYKFDDFTDPILPQNIGRLRSWNPNNAIYGMSPIEVGAILIDMQTAAKKWNLALLQNYARMPGAWVAPVPMGKNERDQLEAKMNGKLSGYANAGKVPVLDGGLTWQSSAIPPAEMDWLKALQYNSNAIANLYNIPPQIIGDTSATTYNNMQEAKAASYTEAIFPALDKLYALWNIWLLPMYPDLKNAYLYYDKDSVEVVASVIQARKDAEADRAVKAYMAGACTLNESLIAQGLPDRGPAGEVYRLGAVLVPADKLQAYAEQSLTTPAAPPIAQPEPIQALPPAGGTTPDASPDDMPSKEPEPEPPAKPPPIASGKAIRVPQRKAAGDVTHILWTCDADACDWCLQNDGVVVAVGDTFPNGATSPDDSHKFCFPAETLVSGAPVVGSTARWYSGSLVEIETASGKFLAGTPNHPILTPRGWVALGLLQEGNEVISRANSEGAFVEVHPNKHNIPTTIKEVAESFCGAGEMDTIAVPGTAVDFHGDGIKGEINIVRANRLLRGGLNSSLRQPFSQKQFSGASARHICLSCLCGLLRTFDGALDTSESIVSRFSPQLALLRGAFADASTQSLGHTSAFNPTFRQSLFDDGARGAKILGKLLLSFARLVTPTNFIIGDRQNGTTAKLSSLGDFTHRKQQPAFLKSGTQFRQTYVIPSASETRTHAGEVVADRILKVSRRGFEGHVYNLETVTGWYTANDIIAHNCKCTATELSIQDDSDIPDGTNDGSAAWLLLIAACTVGTIASRHARDVAAREAALQARGQAISDDMDDDDDDSEVQFGSPEPKPAGRRKKQQSEYRAFMEATLQ